MRRHLLALVVLAVGVLAGAAPAAASTPSAYVAQAGAKYALTFGGGCLRAPDGQPSICADPPAGFPALAVPIDGGAPFTVHFSEEVAAVRAFNELPTGLANLGATLVDPQTALITPVAPIYGRLKVSVDPVVGGDASFAGELPAAPASPPPPPPPPAVDPVPAGMTLRVASLRPGALRFVARSTQAGVATITATLGGVRLRRTVNLRTGETRTLTVRVTAAQARRVRRTLREGGVVRVRAKIACGGVSATAVGALRRAD